MASIANIFIDQGSDYSNVITVTGSNGQPLNLAGYTVASQMRKSYSTSIAYNFNASVFVPSTGKVRLQLTAAQTEAIPPGRYLYDVEITGSSGSKLRVLEGIATVTPQITKI